MKHLILLLLMFHLAHTSAAFPGELTFTQNGGEQFKGRLQGDEWLHWVKLPNDFIAVFNKESKNYEYAIIKEVDGKKVLTSSGLKVDTALHETAPDDLSKKIQKISSSQLAKLHSEQYKRVKTTTHQHEEQHYEKKRFETGSKVWEEILKKPTPKQGGED